MKDAFPQILSIVKYLAIIKLIFQSRLFPNNYGVNGGRQRDCRGLVCSGGCFT